MNESKLDMSSLKNAVNALQKSIAAYDKFGADNNELFETLRSGVIQNYEVAYELCWKFMKRWLEQNIRPDIAMGISRKEFFRIAAENCLITDVEKWWDFHDSRNKTSHIYDGAVADDVFAAAKAFLPYAENLLLSLEQRR
jgi:nucleotidyltransferase substrate binding protein (TIGR01987 family)